MASTRRTREIAAAPEEIWRIVSDPHHVPRWWSQVRRVERVEEGTWTEVVYTKKGKPVRVDLRVLASEPARRRAWTQEVAGTPFERVLIESVIEIELRPAGAGTHVTLEQRQKLRGYSRTGGFLLRRATRERLDGALEQLAALVE